MVGTYRSPVVVLLLCFITCGLYYPYLVYVVSAEIRDYQGRSDFSPGVELLLTLVTCGIWNVYWDYRVGKRVAEMCVTAGLPVTDHSVLYLVLDLVGCGFINPVMQQDSLNNIWRAGNNPPRNPYNRAQFDNNSGSWPPPPGGMQ